MNLTFFERIILDTLCAQFLSHHEVIQKKGFVTRQRKHIVIATWPNLINIPSNKPVKSRTVCVYFVKKYFVEKYSKNRYCFQLWILGILSWTSSAEKTVRKISLLEIRVRIFKKSIWDLPSESYRFLGSDIVFSPKNYFYPITLWDGSGGATVMKSQRKLSNTTVMVNWKSNSNKGKLKLTFA